MPPVLPGIHGHPGPIVSNPVSNRLWTGPNALRLLGCVPIDHLLNRQIRKQIGQDHDVLLQVGAGWAEVWYLCAYTHTIYIKSVPIRFAYH